MATPTCLIVYPDTFETLFDPQFQRQERILLKDKTCKFAPHKFAAAMNEAQKYWEEDFHEYLRSSVRGTLHTKRRENHLLGRSKDDWLYQVAPYVIRSEGAWYPRDARDDWLATITAFAISAEPILFQDNYLRYLKGVLADHSSSVK